MSLYQSRKLQGQTESEGLTETKYISYNADEMGYYKMPMNYNLFIKKY
jgi:hypothetical protein